MRTSSTYGFIRGISAFASSTSQVTCAWGCSARIRQGRSRRFPVYDESRFRSALPPGVRGPILNGDRPPDWPSQTPWPSMDGSYRPTTMPRSGAYAKPGPGQSRPFPPPAPHLGPEHGEVATSPWPMARDQATCRAYTLRRPTGRHPHRRGNTTDLFRTRPAVSGQLALAPPRRQVPCTAETRAAQPGTRTGTQTRGGSCELLLCGVGGFPPEEVDSYVREFTSGFRPFAPDGRPWTRSPTHGTARHGPDHREQLAPVHRLFRRQSLLVPAPHRHHP